MTHLMVDNIVETTAWNSIFHQTASINNWVKSNAREIIKLTEWAYFIELIL